MKKLITISFFLMISLASFSQEKLDSTLNFMNKNSIQLELFGHGLFYSLNYERILINRDKFKTSAQVGLAYYPPFTDARELWIPASINELISFKQHHLELGFGYLLTNEVLPAIDEDLISREWNGLLTGRIGYRYQKPKGRFIFRAGFTPFFEYQYNEFHLSGVLSVGHNF